MQLMPMGDYYVWYCEWCDWRNMTLWTRIDEKEVACGCCQRTFPLSTKSMAKVIADFTTTLTAPSRQGSVCQ